MICSACGKTKDSDEFYINKRHLSGFSGRCKECIRRINLVYYAKNTEKCRANTARWARNNKEHLREYSKKYWSTRRARRNELKHRSYEKLKRENPEEFRARLRKRNKRIRSTVRGALDHRMSSAIRRGLKIKNRSWKKLVPYTLRQLQLRLKRTIPAGFCWDDFLSGDLHIDHIIPLSKFSYDTPNDLNFQKAWDLKNLRLLPAEENIKRSNKVEEPFQGMFKFI